MGWVDKPHRCSPPTMCQVRPELNDFFECDYCKRIWKVYWISGKTDFNYQVGYKLYEPYKFKDYLSPNTGV